MNWTFHPKNKEDITTSIPLSVELNEWKGQPKLMIEGVGEVELKPTSQGKLKADFYMTLPGVYKIKLQDSVEVQTFTIDVAQYEYLDFGREFGFFFVLFLIVMGGIALWTRRIMQKKTSKT